MIVSMKEWFTIAGLQTEIFWEDKQKNFSNLREKISRLDKKDILVFPEMFSTGFTMKSRDFAEPTLGDSENFLLEIASKTGSLVGGSWIEENPGGKPFNTLSFVTPEGKFYRYRKIHPFSYGGEDRFFSNGNSVLNFEWKGLKISPLICYDLRFPEVFRQSVGKTDLYIVVANWPSQRIHHWLALLKARAIENQAYVLGVNRIGIAGKIKKVYHNGYSGFFGPWGSEKILILEREEALEVSLGIKELKTVREEFPYLKDINIKGNQF
ncbi:MAG: carbon-nitrogen family hydrolase [Spirochaetia bacterium]|nr:carbon-nitrogen family hydrolase [Spirochaetia bacterium]